MNSQCKLADNEHGDIVRIHLSTGGPRMGSVGVEKVHYCLLPKREVQVCWKDYPSGKRSVLRL